MRIHSERPCIDIAYLFGRKILAGGFVAASADLPVLVQGTCICTGLFHSHHRTIKNVLW